MDASRRGGPGLVVAAAFLGPGTVSTALVAGATHGATLLWAVAASVLVTFVLQESVARLTCASGRTLGEALGRDTGRPGRRTVGLLAVAAVVVGAIAFQAGNLTGAALAAGAVHAAAPAWFIVAAADVAFLLLWFGRPAVVVRVLSGLVALMTLAFLVNLLVLPVDWEAAVAGLAPRVPTGADLLVVALVGTTVVPYNLFLHGSLVRARRWGAADVGAARRDLAVALVVGGAVTASVLLTAATLPGPAPADGADMAERLAPALGPLHAGAFAVGLMAAGLTSAVTAPLAAAYAAREVLGWREDDAPSRLTWVIVLVAGTAVALAGVEPVPLIVAAQALNGLLLPVVAVVLLAVVNDRGLLGDHVNGRWENAAGAVAALVALALGLRLIYAVFA